MNRLSLLLLLVLVGCATMVGCAEKEPKIQFAYRASTNETYQPAINNRYFSKSGTNIIRERKLTGIQAHETNGKFWAGLFFEGDTVPSITFYYDTDTHKYSVHERDGRKMFL